MYYKSAISNTKNSLYLILIFFITHPLQSYSCCCDENSVRIRPEPKEHVAYLQEQQPKEHAIRTPDLVRMASIATIPHRTQTPLAQPQSLVPNNPNCESDDNAPVNLIPKATLPPSAQAAMPNDVDTDTQFQKLHKKPITSDNQEENLQHSETRPKKCCIFDSVDIQRLRGNRKNLLESIQDAHNQEIPMAFASPIDSRNEGEKKYSSYQNIEQLFQNSLPSIYKKFIHCIYSNLNNPNIQEVIKEQCKMLQEHSDNAFPSELQEIILYRTMDEIREKNITLEYVHKYIENSLAAISPMDFEKEKLERYKTNIIGDIIHTGATATGDKSHNEQSIQKLIQKNPALIQTIGDIFTTLFLKQIDIGDKSPPSDDLHTNPPHFVNN